MDGGEVFAFTLEAVPQSVAALLAKSNHMLADIDLFVFHQANKYMLNHLRKKLEVPAEKFIIGMGHCGNTVSATIPIALKQAEQEGRLKPGTLVMLVGFGVGYSWGATLLRWR
jgi:3-oxoacyl-[acyl-carrier-protein] synthase-3